MIDPMEGQVACEPGDGLHQCGHDITLTERTLGAFPRVASWDELSICTEDSIHVLADTPLPKLSAVKDWASGSGRTFSLSRVPSRRPPLNDLSLDQSYCLCLHDAVLMPPAAGRPSGGRGNHKIHPGMDLLFTARNELLADSWFRYVSLPDRLVPVGASCWKLTAPGPIDVIDEPCVFIELINGHFGHALVEGFARLWPLALHRGWNPADFLFVGVGTHRLGKAGVELPCWLSQIFGAIGIDATRQVRRIWRPTIFRRLFVPKRLSALSTRPGMEADLLARKLGHRLTGSEPFNDKGKKVFLSRSRLPPGKRQLGAGQEVQLDAVFANLGYEIVHPEVLSLSEQVRVVRYARCIAGCAGSQLHLTTFCDSPPPPLFKIVGERFNAPTDALIYWPKNGRVDEYVVPQPSQGSQQLRNKAPWQLRARDFERLPVVIQQWEAEVLRPGLQ